MEIKVGVQRSSHDLQVTPRECFCQRFGIEATESAGVWIGSGCRGLLAAEGHSATLIPDEQAVKLRGYGDHASQASEVLRFESRFGRRPTRTPCGIASGLLSFPSVRCPGPAFTP